MSQSSLEMLAKPWLNATVQPRSTLNDETADVHPLWSHVPKCVRSAALRSARAMIQAPPVIPHGQRVSGTTLHDILIRRKVYQRNPGACYYCKTTLPFERMAIDHLSPKSRGGDDSIENLMPTCAPCNTKKHNATKEQFEFVIKVTREFSRLNTNQLHDLKTLIRLEHKQALWLADNPDRIDRWADHIGLALYVQYIQTGVW